MKTFKEYLKESKETWVDAKGQIIYKYGDKSKLYLSRAEFIDIKDLLSGTVTTKDGTVYHMPVKRVIDNEETVYVGYKIAGWDGNRAYSIYQPSFTISTDIGNIISSSKGIHLGVSKEYVIGYFSGGTNDKDLLLTYEYIASDLLGGDPNYQNGEVLVKQAKLIKTEELS